MSTTELLPCPFCGNKATLHDVDGLTRVICDACGAEGEQWESGGRAALAAERAIEAWNRRASQAQQQAPAEPATKRQLIDYLATRRQDLGGSISEHNHRRLLATQTKAELLAQYGRIVENERAAAAAVQPPAVPLTEARIEQLAVASGLYSGNPRTPGTGNMILKRLRRFVELIENEQVRGIGSVPPSANPDSVHPAERVTGGVRTDAGGQSGGEASS